MPEMIANHGVTVVRKGTGKDAKMKKVHVKAGEVFDFTDDEIEELAEIAPEAIRAPRDEVAEAKEKAKEAPVAAQTRRAARTGSALRKPEVEDI